MIIEDLTQHPNGMVNSADVLLTLDHILASRPFKTSNQCSGLLRYIVEHTLAGEDNLLRERVIGAELFGRPVDYETSEDPVVRLRVSDVRKRLAQYYLTARDQREVQIEIPPGSYRASFRWNVEAIAPGASRDSEVSADEIATLAESVLPTGIAMHSISVEVADVEPIETTRKSSRRTLYLSLVSGIALLLTFASAFLYFRTHSPDAEFRTFWTPWTSSSKPVIISIGSNAVYRLQWEYVDRYARQHGLESSGQEFYIPFKAEESIPGDVLQPAYNSFVATTDVSAISDITTVLTKQSVSFQERFPDDISFAELRNNPSILVGGFNNPMTIELTKNLPFVMKSGSEIYETLNPNRKWALHVHVGGHDTSDYAIITRLVGNSEEPPLMSIAGLGGFGTQGAAKLVADPSALSVLVRELPKGWDKKNLQIVMSFSISDFKVVSHEVVGTRVW